MKRTLITNGTWSHVSLAAHRTNSFIPAEIQIQIQINMKPAVESILFSFDLSYVKSSLTSPNI